MLRVHDKSWLPYNLVLVLLLVGAQSGALAHAFKHDIGTPRQQSCAICLRLSQLDTSCVVTPADLAIENFQCSPAPEGKKAFESFHAPTARQRGPPDPL